MIFLYEKFNFKVRFLFEKYLIISLYKIFPTNLSALDTILEINENCLNTLKTVAILLRILIFAIFKRIKLSTEVTTVVLKS